MSNITFRGAYIRYADLRKQEEAGVFARLHLTAAISEPVMEALEWESIPSCVDQTKLSGLLSAHNLVLTPNAKELRQHELQMECTEIGDFQLFRVKEDDGEGGENIKREELRFIARIVQPGAIALAENYMRLIGNGEGALKITYTDQQKLPGMQKAQGELGAAENGQEPIPLHGVALEAHEGRGTLPSAAEMQQKVRDLAGRSGKAKVQ